MKTINVLLSLLAAATTLSAQVPTSQADSAWLFSYATQKNGGRNGLHFAWSTDQVTWHEIGPEWAPVKSDYGTWGPQKRMLDPRIGYNPKEQRWEARWRVNEQDPVLAVTQSADLVLWKPQDYLPIAQLPQPVAMPDTSTLTLDFSGVVQGQKHRVAWSVVHHLLEAQLIQAQRSSIHSERAIDDLKGRFKNLKPQTVKIEVATEGQKAISDKLIGIFFEDINYAADGGLYAELVQNRDFEYNAMDGKGWEATSWWQFNDVGTTVLTENPIHPNNPHYVSVQVGEKRGEIVNLGWDGIPLMKDNSYRLSLFGRVPEGKSSTMTVQLVSKETGTVLATGKVSLPKGKTWKKVSCTLKSNDFAFDAVLKLIPDAAGTYQLDMVSLFPFDTFMGRENGMRRVLASTIAEIQPKFVRFPGGCASHGNGIDNMYRWKNTIGPLEARKPNWNIWHYHQTVGLGFYEYFQFCEDIGAQPLPVLAAGVPCQNSSVGGAGQQGGIPMDQMDEYVQDVLDLVEWANGDPKTSKWAKMRAEAGHPKPFGLKMIGIGNEDLISDVFTERYKMICKAVKEKYPDIELVGTVGPFWEGSDYEYGWRLAREMDLDHVDEHYYNSPGWFINNQDFYDRYARTYHGKPSTKVYLGEYASHIPGRKNCLETALSEALYLCSVERNGDIVSMTSYAPLLAKKGHTQWNPDLIYFSNKEIDPTPSYQVQRLFGRNSGTTYLPSHVKLEHPDAQVRKRIGSSAVIDPETGDLILKLVNYLPVANRFVYTLPENYSAFDGVRSDVLYGRNLQDTELMSLPLMGVTKENVSCSFEAPAYSFVVIRLHLETKGGNKRAALAK